jgi:DNA-binding transcriptional LysR family regulator
MDQLKAMRSFMRVIDEGSFVGAARALDAAPAVITRAVAELERHLGARLLTRTTRRLALTDIGRRYLERTRAILAAVDEAEALASQAHTQARGLVKICAAPSFAVQQLGPRLARFHALHPDVAVELSASGPAQDPDDRHDITILVRRAPLQGRFVARRLARSELLVCAQPAYLERAGRPRQPQDLEMHAMLAPAAGADGRTLDFVHRHDGRAAIVQPPRAALRSSHPELSHAGALAGMGIAVLPSYLAQADLAGGRLERVLPDWRLAELTIWACFATRQMLPASTRVLLDFLVADLGGEDRDPWQIATPSLAAAA